MKVEMEVFKPYGNHSALERLNEWLERNPKVAVISINHDKAAFSGGHEMMLTVFYKIAN